MAEHLIDFTILIYGFALFFIFFVFVVMLVRYSNSELTRKLVAIFDKLKNTDNDLRQLAEVQMRSKKELKSEIQRLREDLEVLNGTKTQKVKASVR